MSMRGQAAIVGIGELPTERRINGRSTNSLLSQAARLAIADAGLRKEDIDGIITRGSDVGPMDLAEYMGLNFTFCEGNTQHGSAGAHSIAMAAAAIHAGLADTIMCLFGGTRDPNEGGFGPGMARGPCSGKQADRVRVAFRPCRRSGNRLRDDEASSHVRVRHHPGTVRQDGRESTVQCPHQPERSVPGRTHHRGRRSQLTDGQRPSAPAGVRDALRRRGGVHRDLGGTGEISAQPSGVHPGSGHWSQ